MAHLNRTVSHFTTFFLLFLTLTIGACGGKDTGGKHEGVTFTERHPTKETAATKSETPSEANRHGQEIPQKVYEVLSYVRQNNMPPQGYTGGKYFGNFEKRLPQKDVRGRKMNYREWDVNPKQKGKNRGAERLITSADRRAWYTNDHYGSFIEIH